MSANFKRPPAATVKVTDRVRFAGPDLPRSGSATGTVIAVKWSRTSGWWVDVQPDDLDGVWRMVERMVEVLPSE